jgi:hypothetical protein
MIVMMASATVFHVARGEWSSAATTVVLFAMAAFVARKRHRDVPIRARRVASSEARLSMLLLGV